MYLQNLKLEPLDYNIVKGELLTNIENEPVPTLDEVKGALTQMYSQASEATSQLYYSNVESVRQVRSISFSSLLAGSNLWQKLRKFLCGFLTPTSTTSEIIDKVVEFLASIIPGGILIGDLAKRLVKYVLSLGYDELCPIGE